MRRQKQRKEIYSSKGEREKSRSFLFIIHSDILDYYNNRNFKPDEAGFIDYYNNINFMLKILEKSKYKDKNYKKVLTNQRGYDIIEVY